MTKVFKNTQFQKRQYGVTNLVLAVGENAPQGDNWEETTEYEWADNDIEWATNLTHLYTQAGVRIYGYM